MIDMKIATVEPVPFSSVVGRSIVLKNAEGRVIGQLAVMNLPPLSDYKEASEEITRQIVGAFEDLERHKAVTENLDRLSTSSKS